ncbi:serine hydrolase domain-containing protein [Gilvibacter sp.]|uniref:serine hydrolase domain-containing protein n=1 Tax=Gilvibacter sp. TaxID=2729997 RepID=UPI0025C315B8|nr:serine hydrolase domain-containing protein [Gilvibacter sp.]NQX77790.1 beta-lactamase family protein [Gilvibacter sp.]
MNIKFSRKVTLFFSFCTIATSYAQKALIDSLSTAFFKDSTHIGLAIGIQQQKDLHTYYYGGKYLASQTDLSDNSIFELGSVTKVYTTYILSALEEEGLLKGSDLLVDYLPKTFKNKDVLSAITLDNLATHTSGIPITAWDDWALLQNEPTFNENNPFDLLTKEFLFTKLEQLDSLKDYGAPKYSNFGFGLLTVILESASGLNYADLVEKYVEQPLALQSTFVSVPQNRLHDIALPRKNSAQVPLIALADSEGTGALKSSVMDVLKFLSALNDPQHEKLRKIACKALRKPFDSEPLSALGLGWGLFNIGNDLVYWKNGGTYGSGSIVIMCPEKQISVVLLTNSDSTDIIQSYAVAIISTLLNQ